MDRWEGRAHKCHLHLVDELGFLEPVALDARLPDLRNHTHNNSNTSMLKLSARKHSMELQTFSDPARSTMYNWEYFVMLRLLWKLEIVTCVFI